MSHQSQRVDHKASHNTEAPIHKWLSRGTLKVNTGNRTKSKFPERPGKPTEKKKIKYADVKQRKTKWECGVSHRHTRRSGTEGTISGDKGKALGSRCGISRLLSFKVGQWVFNSVHKPALQDSLSTGSLQPMATNLLYANEDSDQHQHHGPEFLLHLAGVLTAPSSDPTPTRVKVTDVSCGPYQHLLPYGGLSLPSTESFLSSYFRMTLLSDSQLGPGRCLSGHKDPSLDS